MIRSPDGASPIGGGDRCPLATSFAVALSLGDEYRAHQTPVPGYSGVPLGLLP
jgi:hypothetical protein